MKTMRQSGWVAAAAMSLAMSMTAAAQQSVTKAPAASAIAVNRMVVVSLEDHKLALVEDGKVIRVYTVAVGKPSTPSPVGTFTIARRVMNPTYLHDGRLVAPGPNNPVGDRWMGLSVHGYGIHGTNVPSSIGKAASHGCIRMGKADIEELFSLVQVGDRVELIGTRNEETAQLFGDGPKPAPATTQQPSTPQPLMTAEAHAPATTTPAATPVTAPTASMTGSM